MLGSGDGARSTLNSMSKPGTQDKTTQKPGARTAHERSKKPNTTKRKTGARQKAHQRQAPGEPDRRSQKEQGGSRTQVSPITFFWEGPVLGSAPFLCGSVFGSAPFASCVQNADTAVRLTRFGGRHCARFWGRRPLGRETGVSSVSIPIPKAAHARPRGVSMSKLSQRLQLGHDRDHHG